jgi:hypothetical protein
VKEPGQQEFHLGVLLALRAHCAEFRSEGARFHEAYGVMLAEAGKTWKMARILAEHFDPVFGVHRAAEDMVLGGMAAMLLSLKSPQLVVARLEVSPAQAEEELCGLPDAAQYRKLARIFYRGLQA